MWVTDEIGTDYERWQENDKIFIAAPTGSGKSTFVLMTLLPYMARQNKRILYLVNRRILQAQIKEEISKRYVGAMNIKEHIRVETYQTLEKAIQRIVYQGGFKFQTYAAEGYSALADWETFDCVVCDEAHYFLADSNFNASTIVSFRWIMDKCWNKINIFISATIDDLRNYVRDYMVNGRWLCTEVYRYLMPMEALIGGYCTDATLGLDSQEKGRIKAQKRNYEMEKDYGFIEVGIINDKNDIPDLVKDGNSKWLIFVDNIEFGNQLKRDLKKSLKGKKWESAKSEIVVVTAEYESDESAYRQVDKIAKKKEFSARILITTSVMDNGISIADVKLRNIIVFADTETEFIQMLGRKRDDSERVKLYILRRDREHFANRLRNIIKLQKIAEDYQRKFVERISRPLEQIYGYVQQERKKPRDEIKEEYLIVNLLYLMWENKVIEFYVKRRKEETPFQKKIAILLDVAYVVYLIEDEMIDVEEQKEIVKDLSEEEKNLLFEDFGNDVTKLQLEFQLQDEERIIKLKKVAQVLILINEEVVMTSFSEKKKFVVDLYNDYEAELIDEQHKKKLQDIFDHKIKADDASALFCAYSGKLYLNLLSVKNLEILGGYYQKVIDQYDITGDKDSFLRIQLSWLHKKPEEINHIIAEAKDTEIERCQRFVTEKIDQKIGEKLSKIEHIHYREDFRKKLLRLVKLMVDESVDKYGSVVNALGKTGIPISKQNMDFLRTHCGLPYRIEVKKGFYTFLRVED